MIPRRKTLRLSRVFSERNFSALLLPAELVREEKILGGSDHGKKPLEFS
jgi:hypothetical protein